MRAQAVSGTVLRVQPTTLPSTCNTGDMRIDSGDSNKLKLCKSNIWGTIVASDLGLGTAGQVLQLTSTAASTWAYIQDANVGTAAAIADTKLGTIQTVGKVLDSATTATPTNLGNTIVERNVSGNFTASTIFATLFSGPASSAGTASFASTASTSGTAAFAAISSTASTSGTAAFATSFNGTIAVNAGGTGNATLAVTNGGILFTDGTKVMNNASAGSIGDILTSNGGGAPSWSTPAGATSVRYFGATATISGSYSKITYLTASTGYDFANWSGQNYTVQATGFYVVEATLMVAATFAAGNASNIGIFLNGTQVSEGVEVAGGVQGLIEARVHDLIRAVANDTISFQILSSGTGPTVSASNLRNFFFIQRVR